jgi:hypothetical protein
MKLVDMRYMSLKSNVSFDEVKRFGEEVNRHVDYTETIIKELLASLDHQIP